MGDEIDLLICQLDGCLWRRFNRIDCLLFAGFITLNLNKSYKSYKKKPLKLKNFRNIIKTFEIL